MVIRYLLPSILWTLFVIILSVTPFSSFNVQELQVIGLDKVVHLGMYTLLTLFWAVGLKKQNIYPKINRNAFKISIIGGISLGIILELTQGFFLLSRHFEGFDLLANGIGCIFGIGVFKLIYKDYYKRDYN